MSTRAPESVLWDVLRGALASRALAIVADLGVAEALADGSRPIEELAGPLRLGEPPVIGVVRDGRLLLDCRTLTDAEMEEVAAAVLSGRA